MRTFPHTTLTPASPEYPDALKQTGDYPAISVLGNLVCLRPPILALLCSVRYPGDIILQMYDLAGALREQAVVVVSGFHAPLERDCLTWLLHGQQPVILCPARSLDRMRVPLEWRTPADHGRLVLLSPFGSGERRIAQRQAVARNQFVAALADAMLIAHAAPGGQLLRLAATFAGLEKPLLTPPSPANDPLLVPGARVVDPAQVATWWPTGSLR